MAEANELFSGWNEHPPTNILVKALVEGFGGMKSAAPQGEAEVPPEAQLAMQRSAAQAITAKAGSRLPTVHGKDLGLPSAPPVFDLDELRKRNADVSRRRVLAKMAKTNV